MKNRGIRIAMISEHASPMALLGGEDAGGQNVYVDELSRQLGHSGYKVDVFTRKDSSKAAFIYDWAPGVRIINVPAGPAEPLKKDMLLQHMPEFRDSMVRFAKSQNIHYDLVHAHFWMSGWVGCELKREWSVPLVQTFHALGIIKRIHQGQADTSPAERFEIERRIVAEADQIIATCPAEQDDLQNYYEGKTDHITIIPCGVNAELFHPIDRHQARTEVGLAQEEKVVLYVGRVLPRKGIDNVISGFAELAQRVSYPLRLMIVGGESDAAMPDNDPELGRLADLAESLRVRHLVSFAGRRPQAVLPLYYSACDVCVTTPWYEPFGMVPLEAMGCGAPVIAAKVGGLKYSVVDAVTGYLVPPKDPSSLANRLETLLERDDLRLRLGNNAQRRVERWFTWPKVTARIADVYTNLSQQTVSAADHSTRIGRIFHLDDASPERKVINVFEG
jgi:glycosyltransferase involved in cell wall biosynthesis